MTTRKLVLSSLLLTLFVLCVGSALPTWAQSTATGTVAGVVTDPSGAVVSGAQVTLTDTTTGIARSTTTNDAGRYIFVNIAPGAYDLSFTKTGFSGAKVAGQTVEIGKSSTINIALKVGSAAEVVEVQATGVELQTMNATVGNTISGIALDALPSLGRDVSSFVTLQPGVTPDGSVAGAIYDQNSFQLDGGQNSNDMDGSMNVYTPSFAGDASGGLVGFFVNGAPGLGGGPTGVMPTPTDSIEEFKVGTNNQTADFNSSAGAQVSMATKRGTNSWHGTVYEYYLDNNWNANLWDNNFTGQRIPSFHYSRFGGAIGGPIISKNILGGKTYFFANYQGFRWPNSETIERTVPSDAMRLGLLQFGGQVYNLNPTPVTFNGVTYPSSGLDPRGLGISPTVQQLWAQIPKANDPACPVTRCDGLNVIGFKGNMAIPQTDNFGVARLDHDFGAKWHFMSSYRYYKLIRATDSQYTISGGVPKSLSSRPQVPWYLVAGLTTNISSNTTNDFHYSYLRNFWQWGSFEDPPQLAGLGGALEPFGESRNSVLSPYNVNTQNTRTRFWDGHDHMFRDDVSMLKGNHLFQFGGTYQRNWNYHQRSDNGGGVNYQPVYRLGETGGAGVINVSAFVPPGAASSAQSWGRDYVAVLGLVTVAQTAFTRSGPNLTKNPPLTHAFDQSTIPYYNVYFSDTWHMKPSFTLTYGIGWTLEMPPTEAKGKQIVLVDQADKPIDVQRYLTTRKNAALQGQVYNPEVGFALVGNVAGHPKYPYDPFYKSFSPRIAAAWTPSFSKDTVIRGGYSRIYGRLNGVALVLIPLLGVGLIEPVQTFGPQTTNPGGTCLASGTNPCNGFRIGPSSGGWDGLTAPIPVPSATLPQPDFPGFNAIAAGGSLTTLDPHFRPNANDQFDLTFQRQVTRKVTMELGYIGRLLHNEYQPININAVPYMMTLGGQSFAKAYANVELQYCGGIKGLAGGGCAANAAAVTPQPFFETALAGTGYCTPGNCTAAVVNKEGVGGTGNLLTQSVWSLWSDLDAGNFNFPRSMLNTPFNCPTGTELGCAGQLKSGVAVNTSVGHGNYNAMFASLKMGDWRGLTMQSNFTWGKALGTGDTIQATSQFALADPYNLDRNYGLQTWDRRLMYNMFFVYQPPFYKGQKGLMGRVLGGWTFAPVFSAGSGLPLQVNTQTFAQSYGEADAINFFAGASNAFAQGFGPGENAVPIAPYNQGNSRHDHIPGNQQTGLATNGFGVNMFTDPAAALNLFRPAILGLDTGRTGAGGILRGLPYWNLDMSVGKTVNITERVNLQFTSIFTNVLNHPQFGDPYLQLGDPNDWGVLPGQWNTPRQMEFGFRVRF